MAKRPATIFVAVVLLTLLSSLGQSPHVSAAAPGSVSMVVEPRVVSFTQVGFNYVFTFSDPDGIVSASVIGLRAGDADRRLEVMTQPEDCPTELVETVPHDSDEFVSEVSHLLLMADCGTAPAEKWTVNSTGVVTPLALVDDDLDGFDDETIDNCPSVANASQDDADGDWAGDACDSNSADPDQDDDGLLDGVELAFGSSVDDSDTDDDGAEDAYEFEHHCLDVGVADLDVNHDDDSLSTSEEIALGTNPCIADTDFDGCSDSAEGYYFLNPVNGLDFFDVPAPATNVGGDGKLYFRHDARPNGFVSLTDVGVVLAYVGRTLSNSGAAYYLGDWNLDSIPDGWQVDRTPFGGPPNGAVSLADVSVVLSSVGFNCVAL